MPRDRLHHRNSTATEIIRHLSGAYVIGFTAAQNKVLKQMVPLALAVFDFGGYFVPGEPDCINLTEVREKLHNPKLGYQRLLDGPNVQLHVHRAFSSVTVLMIMVGSDKRVDGHRLMIIHEIHYSTGRWMGGHEFLYRLEKDHAAVTCQPREAESAKKTIRALFEVINFLHMEGPLRYRERTLPNPVYKKPEPKAPQAPPVVPSAPPEEMVHYVNRPRYIRPQGVPHVPSGREMTPHDRSGHWATSRLGVKFWRKSAKVKGGWPEGKAPRVRRVVLAAPIEK